MMSQPKALKNFLSKNIFLALILLLSISSIIITLLNYPSETKAASITCDGVVCSINSADNTDVVINGATAVISGFHRFKSLKIINGGKLTHDPLNKGENAATTSKKISLAITGDLSIIDGSIDVSGKGYWGSNDSDFKGSGPGGGSSLYTHSDPNVGGGGGGFIGAGGAGILGTAGGAQNTDPMGYGSGGGSGDYKSRIGSGGYGGGVIEITADTIHLAPAGFILANGANGQKYPNLRNTGVKIEGGGGSGGTINIAANTLFTLTNPAKSPTYHGGTGANPGGSGSIAFSGSPVHTYGNISANGGSALNNWGGGGGGGHIILNFVQVTTDCYINGTQNTIPSFCENQDVVIDHTTVNADAVRLLPDGTDCTTTDPTGSNPACDSKRHFSSLTIKNYGVLTHTAVTTNDMYLRGDSLSDESTGTGRWKKVDIVTVGDIVLQNHAQINVDGKGYPGGPIRDADGFGPGKGQHATCDTVHIWTGGAGYQGAGGSSVAPFGQPYDTGIADTPQTFDFGSGSGAARSRHDNVSPGASGGGRIHLIAPKISLDIFSIVSANGSKGNKKYDSWKAGWFSTHTSRTATGGGSGGLIWLDPSMVIASTSGTPSSTKGGIGVINGLNGGDGPSNYLYSGFLANGGDGAKASGGTGNNIGSSGGGAGWITIASGTPPPAGSTITGDIYGKNNVNLGSYYIDDMSVVAGQTVIASCSTCKKLSNYTIDFAKNYGMLQKNISELQKRAVQIASLPAIANLNSSLSMSTPEQVSADPDVPSVNPPKNPEGGVWYVPGNLTLTGQTYEGRGTIIVSGDLIINGNIEPISAADPSQQLGFIVKGQVKIKSSVTKLQAAIYSDNSITIDYPETPSAPRTAALVFKGFLVAYHNIALPPASTESQFTYDPNINPEQPKVALPGFGALQSSFLKRSELAP